MQGVPSSLHLGILSSGIKYVQLFALTLPPFYFSLAYNNTTFPYAFGLWHITGRDSSSPILPIILIVVNPLK